MKPIKLEVQGFGSFALPQIIDFRAVSKAPLFGFYGATGSGKTTILDAICFALFGVSSGGERDSKGLRSDYARPADETFVSLVFAVRSKRYFIYRKPEYLRPKLRGTGLVKQDHEVWLFDVTGLEVDEIDIKSNPGFLLADKKKGFSDKKIQEILGYSVEQFRQVVMLPQGKFREFLAADSKSRSQILRKLFDVSLYERLEGALKEKSRLLKVQINAVVSKRDGILLGAGFDSIEAVMAQRDVNEKQVEAIAMALLAEGKKVKQAKHALELAVKLDELFIKRENVQKSLAELVQQKDQINQLKPKVELCKKSLSMQDAAEQFFHARTEKMQSEQELAALLDQGKQAEKNYTEHDLLFKNSVKIQPEREGFDKVAQQLTGYLKVLNDLQPLQIELEGLKKQKKSEENALKELVAELEKTHGQLTEAKQAGQQLKTDEMEQSKLRAVVDLLKIQQDQLQNLEIKAGTLQQAHENIVEAQKKWQQAEKSFDQQDLKFKALEEDYLRSNAALLAQTLQQGQPCPVCGGRDHPLPMQLASDQHKGSSPETFKKARQQWDKANEQRHYAAGDLKQQEQVLIATQQDFDGVKKSLTDLLHDFPNRTRLKAELTLKTEALVVLKQKLENGKKRFRACPELEQTHEALLQRQTSLQDGFNRLCETLIGKEAQALSALETIPKKLQNKDVLERKLTKAKIQYEQAVLEHEKISKNRQQALSELTSMQDQANSLEAAKIKRIEKFEVAVTRFEVMLTRQGFTAEADYLAALLEPEMLAEYERQIQNYEQQTALLTEQVSRYNGLIGQQERPALTQIEMVLTEHTQQFETLQTDLVKSQGVLQHIKQAQKQYEEQTLQFKELDQIYRRAQTLSDVANGTGDNQRKIRLVDWLLSSYFDEVLVQANLRFTKMTNQQFRLHRKLDKAKGNRVSGLDIDVYDDWSGKSRPSVSLSGGESFLAALALALGLADVVQQESGGVVLEAIFIDEGFGHLDEEALDQALNILTDLSGHNRSVGIISHVEEVKRRVPAGFDVIPSLSGSTIQPRNI